MKAPVVLHTAFRTFFLGALAFSALAMAAWLGVYVLGWELTLERVSPSTWHAHEMIYGYAMAVVGGFLLTAIREWTGRPTLSGWGLAALFAPWAGARICLLTGDRFLPAAALLDAVFLLGLAAAAVSPIVAARQRRQIGVLAKLLLLGLGNALFYLGALGMLESGIQWGIYLGFYLVIGLILMMSRRLIPLFVERGAGYPVAVKNSRLLDVGSLVVFLPFFVLDTFTDQREWAAVFAGVSCVIHLLRLRGWYTHGIWRKPLLWSLYLAYLSITLGFALYVAAALGWVSPFLTVHLFAVGGIGVVTVSMMARVSLGHTGRSVHDVPRLVTAALLLLLATVVFRVLLPALLETHYAVLIMASQIVWIAAFACMLWVYGPMLTAARADGRPG